MSSNDGRNLDNWSMLSMDNSFEVITISISSVTGHKWDQKMSSSDTVDDLKAGRRLTLVAIDKQFPTLKIWHRTGLSPYHQSLIFGESSLSNDQALLSDLGIRNRSLVRLVIVTRSGPLSYAFSKQISSCSFRTDKYKIDSREGMNMFNMEQNENRQSSFAKGDCWNGLRIFHDQRLNENRQTLFRVYDLRRQLNYSSLTKPKPMVDDTVDLTSLSESQAFSAPEDTSAKESSAGDTECDDDNSCSCSSVCVSAKVVDSFTSAAARINGEKSRQNSTTALISNGCASGSTSSSARDRLLMMMNSRTISPTTDMNTHSEDGSEFSSGMVVCDLTNEFRRLRVRRKHHGVGSGSATVQKTIVRNKPRAPLSTFAHHHHGSDLTSSEDERPHRRVSEANFAYSAIRRPSTPSRTQKILIGYPQQRCNACAVKLHNLSNAFHCRCGKTLCARHRPAGMHMCTRIRKLQDVSD